MEGKKITRREFLKKAGKIAAGLAGAGILYQISKEMKRKKIENAPEGIYYLLTGEKIELESINEKNYAEILNKLKNEMGKKLKIEIDFKTFEKLDEGIDNLLKEKNKTIIIVTWPTKDYPIHEPSLGIILDIKENYIKVWDPNKGEVEYQKTLNVWREKNRPLVCLILNKEIELNKEKQKYVLKSIEESTERQ